MFVLQENTVTAELMAYKYSLTASDNLDKLDKSKPVYVHCHSGLRSYIACRLLSGLGFDAYNLSGGYRLYETVVNQSNIEDYSCYNCK